MPSVYLMKRIEVTKVTRKKKILIGTWFGKKVKLIKFWGLASHGHG